MKVSPSCLARFIPSYAKSPIRGYLFVAILSTAAILALEKDTYSPHFLSMIAVGVICAGFLIYAPPGLLRLIGICALIGAACFVSERISDAHAIEILIIAGVVWITWCIDNAGNKILAQLNYRRGGQASKSVLNHPKPRQEHSGKIEEEEEVS